jgi:hypothetical protein
MRRTGMKKYYCYFYLRENGTPYYVGKGCGKRIDSKLHPGISLPIKERRIKIAENLTEEEAINMEKMYIKKYGRKDLGIGILYNRTDGGDNPPVLKKGNINHINGLKNYWNNISEEERRIRSTLISKAKKGKGNNLPTSPVIIVELNVRFESIKECASYINGDSSAVTRCLNGRGQKRHRGYTFRRV